MNTKPCKKCGWIYPANQRGNVCPLCHTPYDEVVCRICGRLVSGKDRVPNRALCKPCHNAEERQHMITYELKRAAELDARYDEWLDLVHSVPTDYPTLTDEQWYKACSYFGGCARCLSEDIDARGFFIGFNTGGRYCDWNVIPLCTKCNATWNTNKNPFKAAKHRDKDNGIQRLSRDCLERVVNYLQPLLIKAAGGDNEPK